MIGYSKRERERIKRHDNFFSLLPPQGEPLPRKSTSIVTYCIIRNMYLYSVLRIYLTITARFPSKRPKIVGFSLQRGFSNLSQTVRFTSTFPVRSLYLLVI